MYMDRRVLRISGPVKGRLNGAGPPESATPMPNANAAASSGATRGPDSGSCRPPRRLTVAKKLLLVAPQTPRQHQEADPTQDGIRADQEHHSQRSPTRRHDAHNAT